MNREQIKHITNIHYRKLRKHIKKVAGDFDVEAIHQFRVEYKKLHGFLRMLSQQYEKAGEITAARFISRLLVYIFISFRTTLLSTG